MSAPPDDPTRNGAATGRDTLSFFFVVDCSGSMAGERIASLNYAVRAAIPAMRATAAEHPDTDVVVRVLRFSDQVEWDAAAPTHVDAFNWIDLTAGGETNMGAAFSTLARRDVRRRHADAAASVGRRASFRRPADR